MENEIKQNDLENLKYLFANLDFEEKIKFYKWVKENY
jgi:uncharacterized protein YccT (UPF0319 family)